MAQQRRKNTGRDPHRRGIVSDQHLLSIFVFESEATLEFVKAVLGIDGLGVGDPPHSKEIVIHDFKF